jgi:hypothetical protein
MVVVLPATVADAPQVGAIHDVARTVYYAAAGRASGSARPTHSWTGRRCGRT